jgi:hypothetical protein
MSEPRINARTTAMLAAVVIAARVPFPVSATEQNPSFDEKFGAKEILA